MKNSNFIPTLFIASNSLIFIGAFMIISGISGSSFLMLTGSITHILFLVATIKEVSNSKSIDSNTKILWYIALIMATTIAGLFYILSARKNITNQNKLTQI